MDTTTDTSARRRALSLIRRPPEHVETWLHGDHRPDLLDTDPAWSQIADLMEADDHRTRGMLEAWASKLHRTAVLTWAERGKLDRMLPPPRSFALAVECMWCGAGPFEGCVDHKSKRLKVPHQERKDRFVVLASPETFPEAHRVVRRSLREGASLDLRSPRLGTALFADVRLLIGSVGGRWKSGNVFVFPDDACADERVRAILEEPGPLPPKAPPEPGEVFEPLSTPRRRILGAAAEFALRQIRKQTFGGSGPTTEELASVRFTPDEIPALDDPAALVAHGFFHGYQEGQLAASDLRDAASDLLDIVDDRVNEEDFHDQFHDAVERLGDALDILLVD